MDPDTFLNRIRGSWIDLIRKETRGRSVRAQTSMWIRFGKDEDLVDLVFNSLMTTIYNLNNLDEIVLEMINNMKYQIENPPLLNSRLIFEEVLYMDINIHQLNLTRGSSYLPLPDWLACKKAIINPINEDQECFKWAVITALEFQNIESHPERISNLIKFSNKYNWSGLGFPVSFKDITKFEFRNQISINLFAIEDKEIYICRKGGNYEKIINLMIISENNRKHYVANKSLSKLLSSKNTNHKGKNTFVRIAYKYLKKRAEETSMLVIA